VIHVGVAMLSRDAVTILVKTVAADLADNYVTIGKALYVVMQTNTHMQLY